MCVFLHAVQQTRYFHLHKNLFRTLIRDYKKKTGCALSHLFVEEVLLLDVGRHTLRSSGAVGHRLEDFTCNSQHEHSQRKKKKKKSEEHVLKYASFHLYGVRRTVYGIHAIIHVPCTSSKNIQIP